MSYQVLARKWRPHDFSSLLGQDHVVRALTHALTENRLHHAYLFTGTRGVGKTTISRILAKCLNCVGPDGKGGITAEPCGVCEACRAIDEDRFVDYIEMDAASTRGIDDMVSLLERAKYVPTNARFKVYMIDEVHQLTSAAFNAMLKTLEEPPEYVKFILATTDPQKVPVTVLSRCLQFNLKSLSPQLISSHMAELLEKEQISFEKPALRMLASGARGSMRDGLSLLDQAIAYSAGNVTLESVSEMLGTIDSTTLIRLLGALANHEPKEIMKVADEIGARSLSYTQAMKDLAVLLHRIAMAQQLPEILTDEEPDAPELRQLASVFSPDEVQLFYQIAIHGYVNYAGEALNLTADCEEELLKSAEYGAGLYFSLMDADATELQNTKYTQYFGANYEASKDELFAIYTRYQKELGSVFHQRIVDHAILDSGITLTVYEDGTKVYVNYNYDNVTMDGIEIPARDYLVMP